MITIAATRDARKPAPHDNTGKLSSIISMAWPGVSNYASQGRQSTPRRLPQLDTQPCLSERHTTPPQSTIKHPKLLQIADINSHWQAIFRMLAGPPCLASRSEPRSVTWMWLDSVSHVLPRCTERWRIHRSYDDTSPTRIEGLRYEACQYCPPFEC